ncbi:putative acetyl xylan esterase [Trichodelitschia bisporula]|uniref:Carboxylic ester hydrolase n=1 Tax=Trichodelitschia bisporula TaxID=703511 RepID=A0A6G1HZ24_9PEZI|nr:putative acetyl xylan esterase [Trichodelitschia bisporula]
MRSLSFLFVALLATAGALEASQEAETALPAPGSLQQIKDFTGPTNASLYIYVPPKLPPSPALLVAVHHCAGNAPGFFRSTPYKALADAHGFIVAYPHSYHSGGCWDVSSRATLKHGGGGDSASIAAMVGWVLKAHPATDKSRVYLTGTSSGAMMTNVLAATYPELFAAAVVYSGVPAGCFSMPVATASSAEAPPWNSTCSQGKLISSVQHWAQIAKDMYPGYSGPRPRMRIIHGGTDTALLPPNYNETIKQWSGVFGYDWTKPVSVKQDTPKHGYSTTSWGPKLEGVWAAKEGHTVPYMGEADMKFFGLG